MAYAIMRISKIKTIGSMVSKYNHNYRQVEVSNASPDLIDKNEEVVPLPTHTDGSQMRYDEAFRDRLRSLPYYQDHKIRSNQVLGYEVLLTYSRDERVDVEKWKAQSVDWLHKTFDVAGDGKSNVLGAAFHADEAGNVHIHAFVVPVDERGHLNAKRFTNGSRALSSLQSSYADAVKDLGLERGIAGSSQKHQAIQDMYADMNGALGKIPAPLPDETAYQYLERFMDAARTVFLVKNREANEQAWDIVRKADGYRNWKINETKKEVQEIQVEAEQELIQTTKAIKQEKKEKERLNTELDEKRELLTAYEQHMNELKEQMKDIWITELEKRMAANYSNLMSGIGQIRKSDPERADRLDDEIKDAIEIGAAYEKQIQMNAKERESSQEH